MQTKSWRLHKILNKCLFINKNKHKSLENTEIFYQI